MITETLQREITQLYMPNAPLLHTCNIDLIDVCLEDQPGGHRLEHQLTFEQFSEKQIEQPSFYDQRSIEASIKNQAMISIRKEQIPSEKM